MLFKFNVSHSSLIRATYACILPTRLSRACTVVQFIITLFLVYVKRDCKIQTQFSEKSLVLISPNATPFPAPLGFPTAEPIEHKLLTFKAQIELSFATLLFSAKVFCSLWGHSVGTLAQKLCQFALPLQANAVPTNTSFSPLRPQCCFVRR